MTLLVGDSLKPHHLDVIYDTGTEDNWVSWDTIRRFNLPTLEDQDEGSRIDFNGQPVESDGIVETEWLRNGTGSSRSVIFHIARNGPFDALFGYKLLIEEKIITIKSSNAFLLVKKNAEATRGKRKSRVGYFAHFIC